MAFTASGARRTGDEYQDLQSAEVSLEWLEQPGRYKWIRLETQDGSLDDIQAALADDSRRLLQVKFATDATASWGWDDLTVQEKGAKSSKPSLLQKWKSSLDHVLAEGVTVSEAALVTNRHPDPELAAHLSQVGLIDFESLPGALKATLSGQLGGAAEAAKFFASFHFRFREPSYQALEDGLWRRFRSLGGTGSGWTNLLRSIRRWINRSDEPTPDGTITFADLTAAALWNLPAEIPQGFAVPNDYVPPETWSGAVVEPRLQGGLATLTVVTGSPGVGKSTYLSWLVEQLRQRDVPVVRHHYFLSLMDRTTGRADWETAADSLIGQLKSRYPELVRELAGKNPVPAMLREFMEAAGRHRNGTGPVVVIIDGLDHAWRETGNDEGLRRLFDQLLPAPEGVAVIVGTQDVDLGRLPPKLRERCPRDSWLEVPRLTVPEVRQWLQFHAEAFDLPQQEEHRNSLLSELADAFAKVTDGHPLLLHYTLSAARQIGPYVLPHQLRTIPGLESQRSVSDYYRRLWEEISPEGHQLLHLLAGFAWPWPQDGLVQCLAPHAHDLAQLDRSERSVRHLLGRSPAGVTAFHESLLAFIRNQPNHEAATAALRKPVLEWLGSSAPEYWRWRHEWAVRADAGDAVPLVSSVTLDWCVDSLVRGRGLMDTARVVSVAGWAALAEKRLGRATELHFLDEYLDQAQHSEGVLDKLVWLASTRRAPRNQTLEIDLCLARRSEASEEELGAMAEVAFAQGRMDACGLLLDEGFDRWDSAIDRPQLQVQTSFSSLGEVLPTLIAACVADPEHDPYQAHLREHHAVPAWCRPGAYAKALGRLCRTDQPTKAQREELRFLANDAARVSFGAVEEIVRLACRDGFDAESWVLDPTARRSGLFRCYRAWVRNRAGSLEAPPHVVSFLTMAQDGYVRDPKAFADVVRSYFFACVAHTIEGRDLPDPQGLDDRMAQIVPLMSTFREVAADLAGSRRGGGTLGGAHFLERLADAAPFEFGPRDFASRWLDPASLARIVVTIAQDLEELFHAECGAWTLKAGSLEAAIHGPWTTARSWVEDCVERRLAVGDPASARLLTSSERLRLKTTRSFLHTRAAEYASLAQFCHLSGESDEIVGELSALSARNLLGHGIHKDVVLFDMLDAIRAVPRPPEEESLPWLRGISPVIQVLSDITDGDTTRYLPTELAEAVGDVSPTALPGYIRALQRRHQHWEVQNYFTEFARTGRFEDAYGRALATTLVHEKALTALQERARAGDGCAEAVLVSSLATLGRTSADPREPDSSSSSPINGTGQTLPSIASYPPPRLGEFARALRDAHAYGDDHLVEWTTYWSSVDPDGLLAELSSYRERRGHLHEQRTATMVVDLAVERGGWGAAWDWLMAYHDAALGWTHYGYPLADVEWIWSIVRARFRNRWLDFVRRTSRPRWGNLGGAPCWSVERMARFLIALEEPDLARDVVAAAAGWGSTLAADMELPDHGLAAEEPLLPTSLRLLVDRLECPSRTVQERAGRAIASLFASEASHAETTQALLDWHARDQLEMRSSLLLLILLLARGAHGATTDRCLAVARQAKLVPSIGAYALLREFGTNGVALANALGYRAQHSGTAPARFAGLQQFEPTANAYLAPVFRRWASAIDEDGIRFSRQWEWETHELARREDLLDRLNPYFDVHYRGSDGFSLAVNDRVSAVLRSAYLRALHWALGRGLEIHIGALQALHVGVMADPELWSVDSDARPAWWPTALTDAGNVDRLAGKMGPHLRRVLENDMRKQGEVLCFAAGPLDAQEGFRADLVIRAYLQTAQGMLKPSEDEMAELPWVGCRPMPPRPTLSGTYASFDPYASRVRDWLLVPLSWWFEGDALDWLRPDRQARGLHLPPTWLLPAPPTVSAAPKQVLVAVGGRPVARYRYWNDDLRERHYRGAGPRVGGELLMRREWLEPHLSAGASLCWVATLSIERRGTRGEAFGEPRRIGTWTLGGSRLVWPTPWQPPDPDDE